MIYKNINIIVAMTEKTRAIGKDGDMIYHLPKDLKYFKETTMGSTVVTGYTTYLSLPKRPLPGRKNIVLCKPVKQIESCTVFGSIEELLEYASNNPDEKIFICGGESIYKQLIPYSNRLYITLIEEIEPVKADRFFPNIDEKIWKKISDTCVEDNKKIHFTVWERK